MKLFTSFTLLLILISCNTSKSIKFNSTFIGHSTMGSHARGLTIKNESIAVSGYKGNVDVIDKVTLQKTHYNIENIEDFRDVHINTDSSLLLINSGEQGKIVKLFKDGTSKIVFNQDKLFLDGISFPDNSTTGFAYGDPLDSTLFILKTTDNGNNWIEVDKNVLPKIITNEAGFAASGTGIQTPKENVVYIGTGISDTARIFRSFDNGLSWDVVNTPIKSGGSFGIYSMFFNSVSKGFIIGGSYTDTKYNTDLCFYTKNKGKTWKNISLGLPGYMSCIHANKSLSLVVTTGRNGSYYSINKGKSWSLLTSSLYYSCIVTETDIIFSGKNGTFEIINYKLM